MATFNVKDQGAQGNGVHDDTQAIQNTIDLAVAEKGGIVFFPPGKYLITATLQVNGLAAMVGSGWSTNSTLDGSFIHINSDFEGDMLNISGRNASVDQLGFSCDQPEVTQNWEPNDFGGGSAVHIRADDITLSNLFLYNVTRGIDASNDSGSIGRITLDRIFGQPITRGIKVDNALDVVKIKNVHFWPFWNGQEPVKLYQMNNATGLVSYRNDNPFYSDIFCLHYKYGMHFSRSVQPTGPGVDPNIWGITSKFKIVNCDLDFCATPLMVDGDNTTGQLCNFSCQGPNQSDPSDVGIKILGVGIHLQATNVYITQIDNNGIRVDGVGSSLLIEDVWVVDWDRSQQGFPGIEVINGANAIVGATRLFNNNHQVPSMFGSIQFAQLQTLPTS